MKIEKISFNEFIKLLMLFMIYVFSLNLFEQLPIERLFYQLQVIFYFIIIIFLFFYFLANYTRIPIIILYLFILVFIAPFYSALRSMMEFGQPFIFGLLAQRGWMLVGSGVIIFYLLSNHRLTIDDVKKSFLIISWTSLIIFSFLAITYDPSMHREIASYATAGVGERGVRFRFQTYFIIFGLIYYFIKYLSDKKRVDVISFSLFFSYILFIDKGRTILIFLLFLIFIVIIFNIPFRKWIVGIFKFGIALLFILFIINLLSPDYLEMMGSMFLQMFQVLLGEESSDFSANARIYEVNVAMNYFNENIHSLFFGVGIVSKQWNDGWESLFGYFYPTDIGLLGALFLYGVVGLIVLLVTPIYLIVQTISKVNMNDQVFIYALKVFIILLLLKTIQGGVLVFDPAQYVIPLIIIISYQETKRLER